MAVPRKGSVTAAPAAVVSCAVTGSSGAFETPSPLQGKPGCDLAHAPVNCALGSVSCKCDTVKFGWISKASITTAVPCASVFAVPVTWMVNVWGPSLRSLIVRIGEWASSTGRAKRSTCLVGPPSTLTSAMPIALPRLPSHRMDVPLKLTVAFAPALVACMAAPPLQPQAESLGVHGPVNVTAALDSSTRAPMPASEPPPPPPETPELLPSPAPPHETSRHASTRTMERFMEDDLFARMERTSVRHQRVVSPRGG